MTWDVDDRLAPRPPRRLLREEDAQVVHPRITLRHSGPGLGQRDDATVDVDEARASGTHRVVRPQLRDRDGEVRVGRCHRLALVVDDGLGCGNPDRAHDGTREGVLDLGQEAGRHRQRLLRSAPEVCGQQHRGACAGQRDVGEASLLGDGVAAALEDERVDGGAQRPAVRDAAPVQVWQAGAVTTQVVGQRVEPDEPALVLDVAGAGVCRGVAVRDGRHRGRAVGGEDALDEGGDGDDVPLESLGGVDGEHLHGVSVGLGVPGVESALLVPGGVEPAEEAGERGPIGGRGVAGGDVGEGVEVHSRRRRGVLGTREDLDVEPDRDLGLGDEVDERQRGEAAQAPDDVTEVVQAAEGLVAEPGAVAGGPPGPGQVVEGLDERGRVGAVGREVGAAAIGGRVGGT